MMVRGGRTSQPKEIEKKKTRVEWNHVCGAGARTSLPARSILRTVRKGEKEWREGSHTTANHCAVS